MKLEQLSEYMTIIIVCIVGALLSIYCGNQTGTGQTQTLSIMGVVFVGIIVALKFRENVWFLIPLTWCARGQLAFLPLPFSLHGVAVLYSFGCFLAFKAVKIVRTKPTYGFLDIVLFLNLLWVGIAYIRNPVGVLAAGSELIGGRPYVETLIAVLAYWIMMRVDLTVQQAIRLPAFFWFSQSIDAVCGAITNFVPSLTPAFGKIYTGISAEAYIAQNTVTTQPTGEVSRLNFLGPAGLQIINLLCAFYRVITIINPLYIIRFLAMLLGFYCIFLSGFRNSLFSAICTMFLAIYFRGQISDAIKMTLVGLPIVISIIAMQGVLFELPLSAQRALSFLPGNWSVAAIRSAEGSTEWRTYMWRAMLTEKRYIKNRWLGDGFGYSVKEFQAMLRATDEKDPLAGQENFLITGEIHSGPISAIRYVGVIGLGLFLVLLGVTARESVRNIRRAKDTPYFPAALFFGIPAVISPFFYVLIFGGYDAALPNAIFFVGITNILKRALRTYQETNSPKAEIKIQSEWFNGNRPLLPRES